MDNSDWSSFVAVLYGLLALTLDRSWIISIIGLGFVTCYIVEGRKNAEG